MRTDMRQALRHFPADLLLAARRVFAREFVQVERISPALDRIVAPGTVPERIAEGFGYTEGPVWMPEGHLLFGDLPHNVIRRWTPPGRVEVIRLRSGYADADIPPGRAMGSNGMTRDAEGRLTICEPGNRRVTRLEPDGRLTILADRFEGKRLNSPNDLVYRSDGSLYFTDPPHGLLHEDRDQLKELPFNGVYRYADGRLQVLSTDLRRPNGIAFSPGEEYLYVSNSDPRRKIWMRYDVRPDGSITNGRVFLDLNARYGQPPDGLKVDQEGHVYCTCPGGLCVVSPQGVVLGFIRTKYEPSNCAWGDDGRTLYMTAVRCLYRIRLQIPGAPWPSIPRVILHDQRNDETW
ncbi:MAG TPA: SMP-30/gluconolactonase/LRE family protein [Vicinamibacterales bacterium]|mgnify:CR=1 FL=1|nr:SMP-30/gluconolactonase/LRE family protein [Vicinamibacterales bacterium]